MKKILLTVSAVVLWVACFSSVSVQSFADCDGECEVSNGPGWSAYVVIPLPWHSEPSAWTTDSSWVVKKWRVIGNNEFGFWANDQDQLEDFEEEAVIDPTTLPAE
jgi:hypothetical protein